MPTFLVSANGPDEPGIVASVTAVLEREGCNLEDTAMTRLAGRFVMLLVVTAPEGKSLDRLTAALTQGTQRHRLHIDVESIETPKPAVAVEGSSWAVTVYGADRPGIVASISEALASLGVNIDDLATRVSGREGNHVYTMMIDVTVPDGIDTHAMSSRLVALGHTLGVTCHAQPVDVDNF